MGKRVKKRNHALQKEKVLAVRDAKPAPQESKSEVDAPEGEGEGEGGENGVPKERKMCPHLEKELDLNSLSGKIRSLDPAKCVDCREGVADRRAAKGKGKQGKKKGSSSGESKLERKAIWICLECGHHACGGLGFPTSSQTHVLKHYKQTHHPLVIQRVNPLLRWCYKCNTLLPVDKADKDGEKDVLSDVVKLIKAPPCQKSSVDVEDVWFGSSSIASEVKADYSLSSNAEAGDGYSARGLLNLGNTCFFNSIMQNLLCLGRFRDFFLNEDLSFGPLSMSLKKLFAETKPDSGSKGVINPRSFFGCVCSKAPQFKGYQQQDSHELLRYLLDGLSAEELAVRKQKKPTQVNGGSQKDPPTFVDTVFGGQISSTVSCLECGHSSVVYEPFLDLSLPVPTKKPSTQKVQGASLAKKTKLPPRRSGGIQPKANVLSTQSIPSSSSSSESPSKTHSVPPLVSNAVGSTSEPTAADSVGPTIVVDGNGFMSQSFSNVESSANENGVGHVVDTRVELVDDFAWMDYLGPESMSDEQDSTSIIKKILDKPDPGDNDFVPNDCPPERNQACSVDDNPNLKADASSETPWEEEAPLQIRSSEVMLLPYKEDGYPDVEGTREVSASSSILDNGQAETEFDGFGDLFNEPEVPAGPVMGPSLASNEDGGSCFVAGNSSESDPDEVDNAYSPVSVASCLALFVKPELLCKDNAWECENCSRILQSQMLEAKQQQGETASGILTNGGDGLVEDHEKIDNKSYQISCKSKICLSSELKASTCLCENEKGLSNNAVMEQSHCSSSYETCSQETLSDAAVDSGSADASTSSTYTNAKDQLSIPQLSSNSEPEENETVKTSKVNVKRDATKRVFVKKAPPILTIHLKRFTQDARGRLSKLNGHVFFEDILDVGPYIDPRCEDREKYIYRLIGVVEHSGTMRRGHYVAYVRGDGKKGKVEQEKKGFVWYHASDAYVREVSLQEVLGCEAYILFYEKI